MTSKANTTDTTTTKEATMDRTIRSARLLANFSRGFELLRAIRKMWDLHTTLPAGSNTAIAANIEALMAEFDLTLQEWYYWSKITAGKDQREIMAQYSIA